MTPPAPSAGGPATSDCQPSVNKITGLPCGRTKLMTLGFNPENWEHDTMDLKNIETWTDDCFNAFEILFQGMEKLESFNQKNLNKTFQCFIKLVAQEKSPVLMNQMMEGI